MTEVTERRNRLETKKRRRKGRRRRSGTQKRERSYNLDTARSARCVMAGEWKRPYIPPGCQLCGRRYAWTSCICQWSEGSSIWCWQGTTYQGGLKADHCERRLLRPSPTSSGRTLFADLACMEG